MTVSFQNGSFFGGTTTASVGTQSGGVTAASLYNTDYLDSKYEYTDTKEGYEVAYTGRDAAIDSDISNITSYILNGQEDKVIAAYESLLDQMSSQSRYAQLITESGDDTQLRAVARQLIEAETGVDLATFIRENTRDSVAVQKQQLLWGDNCDSTTQEALLAEMCDIEEEEGRASIFSKAIFGFAGIFTKGWDAIFGDGKKH